MALQIDYTKTLSQELKFENLIGVLALWLTLEKYHWVGGPFDPRSFDVNPVNARIGHIR
jgi:hypothetical protein